MKMKISEELVNALFEVINDSEEFQDAVEAQIAEDFKDLMVYPSCEKGKIGQFVVTVRNDKADPSFYFTLEQLFEEFIEFGGEFETSNIKLHRDNLLSMAARLEKFL